MKKKLSIALKVGVPSLLVASLVIALPFSVLNTLSYDFFAQIIVSDNTSILADHSFSESTFNGFKEFMAENNINLPAANSIKQSTGIWRRPGGTTLEREATLKGAYASGTNMVIAPGFNHQTPIENVALNPLFHDMGFLLLDSSVNAGNVSSFLFRADQSGFLSGIAASQFLHENETIFSADDGKLKIGGYVGIPFASTMDFLGGFQAGMFAWNSAQKPGTKLIEWISLGTSASDYASGGFGVGQGVAKSQQLIDKAADVIIPVAGPQAADTIGEILKQNKKIAVVGVDSPQELQTINKEMPGNPNLKNGFKVDNKDMIIQFSAVKELAQATKKTLQAIFKADDPNNENDTLKNGVKGFGYINTGTLENETVGVSAPGLPFIKRVFPTWFNTTTGKLDWSIADGIKNNLEFLNMTNKAFLYHGVEGIDDGNLITRPAADTNIVGKNAQFNPLPGGVAIAKKVSDTSLNGSKWKIQR